MLIGASPVSPHHPIAQPTVTHSSAQNQRGSTAHTGGDNNANKTPPRDSQPTQSSHAAPGTGSVVDKHV